MTAFQEPSVASAPVDTEGATSVSDEKPIVLDDPRDETERLEPLPTGPITLVSGTEVVVVPLKLRETMKLLKVITRGAGSFLQTLLADVDANDDEGFAQTLLALVIMSVPEAENEVVDFLQSMVEPVGFSTMTRDAKIESLQGLAEELANPDLDDVVSILERVISREASDIRGLGKRIGNAFKMASKVNALSSKNRAEQK